MSEIVKLYNPANSGSLTPEQLAGLQELTSVEIKELSLAYPNRTMNRAYLLIIDGRKPAQKQLPALSTFENLYNLREKNGQKYMVAFNFKGNYKPITVVPQKAKKIEVVDLSDEELKTLPGFKAAGETFPPEVVKIKRIRRTKKEIEESKQ